MWYFGGGECLCVNGLSKMRELGSFCFVLVFVSKKKNKKKKTTTRNEEGSGENGCTDGRWKKKEESKTKRVNPCKIVGSAQDTRKKMKWKSYSY